MRFFTTALLMLATAVSVSAQTKVPAELEPLTFLLGDWEGVGAGNPGQANGETTFSRSLQGRVIVRTSYAQYPASSNAPPSRHDDVMIIYVEQDKVRADYYDNEGHVIRYAVTSPSEDAALFVSDVSSGTPRYRLSYRLGAERKLSGRFEIAPPGKPDDFSTYLTWETRRKEQSR